MVRSRGHTVKMNDPCLSVLKVELYFGSPGLLLLVLTLLLFVNNL